MSSVKKRNLTNPDTHHNLKKFKVDEKNQTDEFLAWVEKYKPVSIPEFVGNQKTTMELINWLREWGEASSKNKQTATRESTRKCALVSGPSGVGKTSLVRLATSCSKYTPLDTFRFENRNKDSMKKIMESTSMTTISNFLCGHNIRPHGKRVLIVDDADCFCISDKGGLKEIVQNIRKCEIPIIFICNDRYDPKLKPLLNHCTEFKLTRPTTPQIIPRIKKILGLEKVVLDDQLIARVVDSANGDVRQCINTLQWICTRRINATKNGILETLSLTGKDSSFHLFESIPKIFDQNEPLDAKLNIYFGDSSLVPLMVHENYLRMCDRFDIDAIVSTCESISAGDVYDAIIHKEQIWEAYPIHGMVSSVIPGQITKIKCRSYPKFPEWLGKNSSHSKRKNIIKNIKECISPKCKSSRVELCDGYLETLCMKLSEPLVSRAEKGIDSVIATMDVYSIDKDTRTDAFEAVYSPYGADSYVGKITPQLKAKLTRKYNTLHKPSPTKTKLSTNNNTDAKERSEESDDEDLVLDVV